MTPTAFRLLCYDKNYRLNEIAKRLGVSVALVSHWNTGRAPIAERYWRALEALPAQERLTPKRHGRTAEWYPAELEESSNPVRRFRMEAGYAQGALAHMLKVSASYVTQVERLDPAQVPGPVRAAIEQATRARVYYAMLSPGQQQEAQARLDHLLAPTSTPTTKETGETHNPFSE